MWDTYRIHNKNYKNIWKIKNNDVKIFVQELGKKFG